MRVNSDWRSALNELLQSATTDEMVVVSGSLYFISEVRQAFLARESVAEL